MPPFTRRPRYPSFRITRCHFFLVFQWYVYIYMYIYMYIYIYICAFGEILNKKKIKNAYCLQQDMTLWIFLEVFALQKCDFFKKFYNDQQLQGYLLQELNDQTQCDDFGENLMKIRLNGVGDMQCFFPVFQSDFSTWKMETKLCGNLHSCNTLFIDLEYLDHNSPNKYWISRTVCEKTDSMCIPLLLD